MNANTNATNNATNTFNTTFDTTFGTTFDDDEIPGTTSSDFELMQQVQTMRSRVKAAHDEALLFAQANARSHHTPDITHAHTKIDDHMDSSIMKKTKSHHHNYVQENASPSSAETTKKSKSKRELSARKAKVPRQGNRKTTTPSKHYSPESSSKSGSKSGSKAGSTSGSKLSPGGSYVKRHNNSSKKRYVLPHGRVVKETVEIVDPLEIMRQDILSAYRTCSWFGAITKCFSARDRNRSGTIQLQEFRGVLRRDLRVPVDSLGDSEIRRLFSLFQNDNNELRCKDFCNWMVHG